MLSFNTIIKSINTMWPQIVGGLIWPYKSQITSYGPVQHVTYGVYVPPPYKSGCQTKKE